MNFKIVSINERFDSNGYTQPSVEFELEPALNLIDTKTGEIKGYTLFKSNNEPESEKLSSIDMRLINLDNLPVKLLMMRDSV